MSENINHQSSLPNNEQLHNASVRSYLGRMASGALEIGFVASSIVGATEIASRVIGESDHLSVPVATAMATAIYASSHRRKDN